MAQASLSTGYRCQPPAGGGPQAARGPPSARAQSGVRVGGSSGGWRVLGLRQSSTVGVLGVLTAAQASRAWVFHKCCVPASPSTPLSSRDCPQRQGMQAGGWGMEGTLSSVWLQSSYSLLGFPLKHSLASETLLEVPHKWDLCWGGGLGTSSPFPHLP